MKESFNEFLLPKENVLFYKQNHLADVLNNKIVLEFLKAINGNWLIETQCKYVFMGCFMQKVIPVASFHDCRGGCVDHKWRQDL